MFLISLFVLAVTADVPRMTPAEVRPLVEKNEAVLVDVRGSVPYEIAHIAGAVWLPLGLVNQRAGELPDDKLIVTYCTCKSEDTSLEAAAALRKLGFTRVAVLQGGYPAWVQAGYPTASLRESEGARGRLAPPAAVTCDRNQLTTYSGRVVEYRRKRGRTTLVIRTDEDTTERVTLAHAKSDDPSRFYLVMGTPFTKADWNRVESKKGVLQPGMRATAWVCQGGRTIVDFRPGETGGAPR